MEWIGGAAWNATLGVALIGLSTVNLVLTRRVAWSLLLYALAAWLLALAITR